MKYKNYEIPVNIRGKDKLARRYIRQNIKAYLREQSLKHNKGKADTDTLHGGGLADGVLKTRQQWIAHRLMWDNTKNPTLLSPRG